MDPLQPGDPTKIGGYQLLGRLGQGGMGQVFLGRSPGGRKVAVKLIHPRYADDPEFRRRFSREVDAARRVGGHYTAQVIDADPGADPPWMVTAYVDGPSLRQAVDAVGPLPEEAVQALGACLAEGLAAIHDRGLVHRDVKPGNVILAADGPRIIDFGIARAFYAKAITHHGEVLGTFAYMSPEQARGHPVGPASDVFSLGSVLAFAATGHGPFDGSDAPVLHLITHQPPTLTGVPESLRGLIAACLEKNPADRITATGILERLAAADMSRDWPPRVIANLVNARAPDIEVPRRVPPSGADPKHNQSTLMPPDHLAGQGDQGFPSPNGVGAGFAPPAYAPPAYAPAPNVPPFDVPGGARQESLPPTAPGGVRRRTVLLAGLGTAAATVAVGVPVAIIANFDEQPESGGRGTGGSTPSDPNVLTGHTGSVTSVAFSPDGRTLASASADRTIRLWDLAGRRSRATLTGHAEGVMCVAFSPDWKTLASGGADKTIRLWDLASRSTRATLTGHADSVNSVAFSPDGGTLGSGSTDQTGRLWNVASGRSTATLRKRPATVNCVTFGPDGSILMTGYADNTVGFWQTAKPHAEPGVLTISDISSVNSLALTGELIAIGATPGIVSLWDGKKSVPPPLHTSGPVNALAFHRDGTRVAVGTSSGTVLLWDTDKHEVVGTPFTGHRDAVTSVAFSPDGKLLASGSTDRTIRLWNI